MLHCVADTEMSLAAARKRITAAPCFSRTPGGVERRYALNIFFIVICDTFNKPLRSAERGRA